MNRHRTVLNLESLEGRDNPSALHAGAAADVIHTMPVETAQVHQPPHIQGHVTGQFTQGVSNPDTGRAYDLTGTAKLAKLGDFEVTGSVQTIGNVASGQATGTLSLTNSEGSLTIQLKGPVQTDSSALPHEYHYKVLSGTGAYAHDVAQGTLHLTIPAGQSSGHFAVHFQK